MRQFINEANAKAKPGTTALHRKPNREWAGDMPKIDTNKSLSTISVEDRQVGGVFGRIESEIKVSNLKTRLVPETNIENCKTFAGYGTTTTYRKSAKLAELYGGDPEKWAHTSGNTWVFHPVTGQIVQGEFHWAEEPTAGIHEFRLKRWIDKDEG
jgi:hypothetical protein